MLRIGIVSLICSLVFGVFGFGVDAPSTWTWQKSSFVAFFLLAVFSFVDSELQRPSLLWEVVDELHRKRRSRARQIVRMRQTQ